MSDPPIVDAADPDEAFGVLSDPARIDVLRALWEADGRQATFSELREAIGMRDSGRFNYHLGKLTGRFVAKTEDGYRLRLAGVQVVGSLYAGVYTKEGDVEPIPIDEPCPSCGGAQTFRYEDEWVRIDCDACELATHFPVPPGVFAGYDGEPLPTVAERYLRTLLSQAVDGFCPYCEGPIRPTVVTVGAVADPEATPSADLADVPMARYECGRCGEELSTDLGTALLDHPAVVSFYHDHGVDVRQRSFWRFIALDADRARILDREPLRASATYAADGDELTVTVDGSLSVLDVERDDA